MGTNSKENVGLGVKWPEEEEERPSLVAGLLGRLS
jgi:hypothetical protein